MLYNISMLVLTIVGVVGTVVYSYKMSRTRVYTVGIGRKPPVTQPVAPSANKSLPVTEPKRDVTPDFVASYWVGDVKDYFVRRAEKSGLSASESETFVTYNFDDVFHVSGVLSEDWGNSGSWKCPQCGLVQKCEKEERCMQCSYTPKLDTSVTGSLETTKASALQTQVSHHDQTLRDLDKRIRELEKDSVVKKTAEVAREEERKQQWLQ